MGGAVLVQRTSWKNVELALGDFRQAGLLDPYMLNETHASVIARPAGFFVKRQNS